MKFSRSATLPPVIVTALFTLLLSGCGNGSDAMPATQDEASSSAMTASESSATSQDMTASSAATDASSSSMPVRSSAMTKSSEAAVIPKQKYGDGTFAAVGDYRSPAGAEEVNVSLTLKKGIVTAATFQGAATNEKSVKFQGMFGQGFQEAVVGKSIDGLNLTVVNGSSLTPAGFMDALSKIKAEAMAKA